MLLTTKDLETLQVEHPDLKMELTAEEIIVMSPSRYESDEVAFEFGTQLQNWVRPQKLRRVTGSSAEFVLPNSDTRAPDVSLVPADRLRRSPCSFAEWTPDLRVEVKLLSDSLTKLRNKIDQFLNLGTRVGILIDPEPRSIEIRRSDQDPIVLHHGDTLTVPDLVPG
jgi:Uma2 family endonuclease